MAGALDGIRVLDLSRILAGPWASQNLADLGAEVIKVERPLTGDDTRTWGPPYIRNKAGENTSDAAYFLSCNRNKESIAIDLSKPEGQELVRELAKSSDILVENYKVGGLEKYGLDYASLAKINPKLIYCSITGFGQTGPYAKRAGYDFLIQGMAGLMSITGRSDNEEGGGPLKVGVALSDILTGLYASTAILAALVHRNTSGEGQHIDLSLMDVQVSCLANQAMNYLMANKIPERLGNGHPNVVPYQDFPTADGHMILAIGNDNQFTRFCIVIGKPEWSTDERFLNNFARLSNRNELVELIREQTRKATTADWVKTLEAVNVPCGPINNLKDVFDDPHVLARNLKRTMDHPIAGEVPTVSNPIRMSLTPIEYRTAAPLLGQHTHDILTRVLGMESSVIEQMIENKTIQSASLIKN